MIPDWMIKEEEYTPLKGGNAFVIKSIKAIGKAMSKIKIQKGYEKGRSFSPLLKLLLVFAGILLLSIAQSRLIVMTYAAGILIYLCTRPAGEIAEVLEGAFLAGILTFFILIPAIVMDHALLAREITIAVKVFLSILSISIFNHNTQWNNITGALRKLHIPAIFIFTLDMSLKYIVLLGNLILELLTSLKLRSVGKNNRKYTSIGGIIGITFIRGALMSREMYEAMQCRCFTDDYKGI